MTLKPCPFCGGEADTIRNDIGVFIGCFNDDCPIGPATSTYIDGYATESEAVAAWNARADFEFGGIPCTEENMKAHGWVRERTCKRFWTGIEMICSICAYQLNSKTANYCPNCGAKVEAENDNG